MYAFLIKIILGIFVGIVLVNWFVGGQTEIICLDETTSAVEQPARCS